VMVNQDCVPILLSDLFTMFIMFQSPGLFCELIVQVIQPYKPTIVSNTEASRKKFIDNTLTAKFEIVFACDYIRNVAQ
jgi:hypothetical protein